MFRLKLIFDVVNSSNPAYLGNPIVKTIIGKLYLQLEQGLAFLFNRTMSTIRHYNHSRSV